MRQLTGLDASFLAFETANSTGHVGGLCVLDPSAAPKPLTLARLTEVLGERLPLVPVLRRKILNVPLGLDQPYWIDDADFDIEYHIREIALPDPGSDAQLNEQVARLHARPLDRSRPLWEIYLITGLAQDRAAVYTKIHHSAIDGASGAELLTVLLDLAPGGGASCHRPSRSGPNGGRGRRRWPRWRRRGWRGGRCRRCRWPTSSCACCQPWARRSARSSAACWAWAAATER
jgi:WS/DGAT/MGAT family acyltransferase